MSEVAKLEANVINVSAFGISDIGRVRKNNEDNFVIFDLSTGEQAPASSPYSLQLGPQGLLLLVADGMGGEASGEVASSLCASTVPPRLQESLGSLDTLTPGKLAKELRKAVEHANQVIFEKARSDGLFRGMGTTATAAVLFAPYLVVAQVGDSRAYICRHKALTQLTRDQTFLNYLKEIGAELPADLEHDRRKSILTQAVGASERVDVKVTYSKLRDGDRILLCSDGLYNMVKQPEILGGINGNGTLADKCERLIQAANEGGGTDNVTVILAEVTSAGLSRKDTKTAVQVKEYKGEDDL